MTQAREPMGCHKKDHIRYILQNNNIRNKWISQYKYEATENDIENIYNLYTKIQLDILTTYCNPLPETYNTLELLKNIGIWIGTTTGFNREILDKILQIHTRFNNLIDSTITSDEVPVARPSPFMIYKNINKIQQLDFDNKYLYKGRCIIKVDDTEVGIEEGINAGVWTIGVSKHSNLMGEYTDNVEEYQKNEPYNYMRAIADIENRLYNAGANYVIDDISRLPHIITNINEKLELGFNPK